MSTTGTYLADPTLAEYADEAFERAGVSASAINGEHIRSFRRSVGLVFSAWATDIPHQWKFGSTEHTVTVNETEFDLPAGLIDVQTVMLRRSGYETEMTPFARSDYQLLHDKSQTGRPDKYYVDKRRDTDSSTRARMIYWRAAENSTDVIVVSYFSQMEDVGTAGAGTLDVPYKFQEALSAELAARMAEKFKPERYDRLRVNADRQYRMARGSDAENAALVVTVDMRR